MDSFIQDVEGILKMMVQGQYDLNKEIKFLTDEVAHLKDEQNGANNHENNHNNGTV